MQTKITANVSSGLINMSIHIQVCNFFFFLFCFFLFCHYIVPSRYVLVSGNQTCPMGLPKICFERKGFLDKAYFKVVYSSGKYILAKTCSTVWVWMHPYRAALAANQLGKLSFFPASFWLSFGYFFWSSIFLVGSHLLGSLRNKIVFWTLG